MHDLYWRLTGLAALATTYGLGVLARHMTKADTALLDAIGNALALGCLALACFGLLMLLHGSALQDRWRLELHVAEGRRTACVEAIRALHSTLHDRRH